MKIINNKIARQKATFKVSISITAKGFNLEILRYTKLQLMNEGVTPELRKNALSLECFIGKNGDYALNDITSAIQKAILLILENETILQSKDVVVLLDD